MKKKAELPDVYDVAIQKAVDKLYKKDFGAALTHIKDAVVLKMDAPEPHNLLGILAEINGDDGKARKHYRAAYALDPTYKPACRNLERLVDFFEEPVSRQYDYGIESESIVTAQPQAASPVLNREDYGTAS